MDRDREGRPEKTWQVRYRALAFFDLPQVFSATRRGIFFGHKTALALETQRHTFVLRFFPIPRSYFPSQLVGRATLDVLKRDEDTGSPTRVFWRMQKKTPTQIDLYEGLVVITLWQRLEISISKDSLFLHEISLFGARPYSVAIPLARLWVLTQSH